MATNGDINDDADIAECDGEKVVTMMDVLQEEQDFEDDANAVLGASDEKNCTYSKGYIKRQAIYACLTCCFEAKDDPTKRAGVCLACSLNCHENHELIELYTKRNFRCDCGNPKFNFHPCQFTSDKSELNDDNKYNQNFSGLYCNCHRPYPDPESTVDDDEMIQCIICEDWLHASHIDAVVPGSDQYSEMVCKVCMDNNEFLHDYSNLAVNVDTGDVDIIAVNGDTKLSNGELETEKLVNGSGEINENFKLDMDVDGAQNENESSAVEHTEAVEKEDSEKSAGENKINDCNDMNALDIESATDAEKTQMASDSNPELNDDTNTVTALEETSKAAGNTFKEDKSGLQDQKETIPVKVEDEAKTVAEAELHEPKEPIPVNVEDGAKTIAEATLESEDTEDTEKNVEEDIPELVNPKEHILELEVKDQLPEITHNTLHNIDNKKEDEIPTLNSIDAVDADSKEEVRQTTTENVDTSEDTKTTSTDCVNILNNTSNEIEVNDSCKEPAVTDNVNVANEEDMTNKVNENMEENDKISNETPETEINDSAPIVESTETIKNVNTDDIAENQIEIPNNIMNDKVEKKETKRKLSTEEDEKDTSVKRLKLDKESKLSEECKLNEKSKCIRPKGVKKVYKGATFWPSNFRQKLCTCNECLSMYKDLSILFLIDPEDTVSAYETLGKERVDGRVTQYEKGLEALSSLDRIQQINALTEYNKMKDKLLDFLKSFKDRKEIVKEEDIKAFFAGMKPKREPDGVYFCR